jgi:hypothetical protein
MESAGPEWSRCDGCATRRDGRSRPRRSTISLFIKPDPLKDFSAAFAGPRDG